MKLVIRNLDKSFKEKEVLEGVSYEFDDSKIYGLLGRNGAGKTTLFNIIYGETKSETGEILIEENGNTRKIEVEDIGMVFTENQLPGILTGYEFIKFYIDIFKDKIEDLKTIDEYFDLLEFDESDRHRLILEYSHGMMSKISILTILISKPKIILLDEPLADLDVVVSAQIKKQLKNISEGRVIIFSTHILQLATELCDDIVLLHNKRLNSIDTNRMHEKEFEEFIINALQEKEA